MTASYAGIRREDDAVVVVVAGDWKLENEIPSFGALIASAPSSGNRATTLRFEAGELGTWDSSLLIFIRQAHDYCDAHQLHFDPEGLPASITRLLDLARVVPDRVVEDDVPTVPPIARIGMAGIAAGTGAMAAITFTGGVAQAVANLMLRRVRMRWREFWVVVQSNSSGALPIVTLIALLVGVIVAFLGVVVLKRFGAGYYVSYLSGYGMLREMGALMTGIIMAGRTGAGFAAEIGSMKITEEIDAYTTLGISPIDHLVVPRVLGLFVMMPLLAIYANFVGIAGGMAVAIALLDLTPTQFITGLLTAVTMSDALLGVFKATVFGAIIGIAGCMKGLQTGTGAGAVGRSTTSAVVLGITLVIFANAIIDWLAALLQI